MHANEVMQTDGGFAAPLTAMVLDGSMACQGLGTRTPR